MIVLGGCAAIEDAARKAGFYVKVPFTPGRVDAGPEHIDVNFYSMMEPFADRFRNYIKDPSKYYAKYLLVHKANLFNLTVPEMTILVGGLRSLGINYKFTNYGVLMEKPGLLSNDFFVNLLDMKYEWKSADDYKYLY